MSELQTKIVEYLKTNRHADGIDLATALRIPVDMAYREVQALIDKGVIRKQYIGLATRLVVENA